MYDQGIRAYYRGDAHAAIGFFDGALVEDSLFALAAYYGALSAYDTSVSRRSSSGSDSNRLMILFNLPGYIACRVYR
jgi:hypothetical protein